MTFVDAAPNASADAERLPFFVYGTLRPGAPNHTRFLSGRTRSGEPAHLTGATLYPGPGYPYAVEGPDGVVTGDLVTARPEAYADLLATLDRLEEYTPGDPRNLYDRVARNVVRTADGTLVRAWVYVAAPAVAARLRARATPIAGGEWRIASR
ncbi:gamma-glutamylcyclotransferase family protein [Streptomyces mutabilis]|uniref:gamma-glutamylcyclotransferase family protein n=1 Tax=Streptomyces mutabilis TaxID=67332 RepID=UPI00177E4E94|nr:gamma-glutamylcyclotransferase family protein [Streptomyces mutabilis]GGP99940.1 gamma-glutamylcyclotransferase [Streptomyces mutabilis]